MSAATSRMVVLHDCYRSQSSSAYTTSASRSHGEAHEYGSSTYNAASRTTPPCHGQPCASTGSTSMKTNHSHQWNDGAFRLNDEVPPIERARSENLSWAKDYERTDYNNQNHSSFRRSIEYDQSNDYLYSQKPSTEVAPITSAYTSFPPSAQNKRSNGSFSWGVGKVSKKKDPDRPKRPLSAYNFFFKEERERILELCNAADAADAEQARDNLEVFSDSDFPDLVSSMPKKKPEGTTVKRDPANDGDDDNDNDSSPLPITAEEIARVRKDNKAGIVSFEEMGKVIGRRWKIMASEYAKTKMKKYAALAAKDTERYKKEMAEFHAKQEAKNKAAAEAAKKEMEAARKAAEAAAKAPHSSIPSSFQPYHAPGHTENRNAADQPSSYHHDPYHGEKGHAPSSGAQGYYSQYSHPPPSYYSEQPPARMVSVGPSHRGMSAAAAATDDPSPLPRDSRYRGNIFETGRNADDKASYYQSQYYDAEHQKRLHSGGSAGEYRPNSARLFHSSQSASYHERGNPNYASTQARDAAPPQGSSSFDSGVDHMHHSHQPTGLPPHDAKNNYYSGQPYPGSGGGSCENRHNPDYYSHAASDHHLQHAVGNDASYSSNYQQQQHYSSHKPNVTPIAGTTSSTSRYTYREKSGYQPDTHRSLY